MREIFVIRSKNPLDMEGSPDVVAVTANQDYAKSAARKLNAAQEEYHRKRAGERWRSFASQYEVETWPVLTTFAQIEEMLENETS